MKVANWRKVVGAVRSLASLLFECAWVLHEALLAPVLM